MKTPSLSVTTPSPPFTAQRSFRDQRVIGSIRNVMLQRQFSYEDSPPSSSFSDSAPRRTSIVAAVASAVAPPTSSSIPGHLEGHDSRYASIPQMEMTKLPRGGIILQSKALKGPIQFGIPPETIKDSMTMGLPVPGEKYFLSLSSSSRSSLFISLSFLTLFCPNPTHRILHCSS